MRKEKGKLRVCFWGGFLGMVFCKGSLRIFMGLWLIMGVMFAFRRLMLGGVRVGFFMRILCLFGLRRHFLKLKLEFSLNIQNLFTWSLIRLFAFKSHNSTSKGKL